MSGNPPDTVAGCLDGSSASNRTAQQAFLKQRPLYVNLLDDLGSGDFFVIDGDSLLLDALASLCRDACHGMQMLQLSYLVESFLDSLQKDTAGCPEAATHVGVVQHFDWVSSAGAASCAQLLQSGSPSPHVPSKLDSQAFKEHPRLLFCKAWCLHEAAKLHLPLEARCLDLANLETHTTAASDAWTSTSPGDDQPAAGNHAGILHDLRSFMDDWCASFHEMLLEATAAGQLEAADRVKLLDAVDGRLWHFMTCCLLTSVPVGLPANARQTAQQLMQAVCQLAGIAANSITTDPHMQSHVSGGSQGQQPEAEGPDKPASSSLLVPRHTVHGNAFVDAFLAPQAATEGGDGMVAGDQQLALFDEAYHWHTGRPLEPTYLGETGEDRIMAAWRNATLLQMTHCPMLPPSRRRQLASTNSMCADVTLIPSAEERRERMKSALKVAQGWLETSLSKRDQRQATFMRNYANSMMSTAYQGPAAVLQRDKRKGSSSSRSNSSSNSSGSTRKAPKPVKLSKADLIRQQQTEKRAAEDAAGLTQRWSVKQQELERGIQVTGWNSRLQSEVENFLSQCKHGTPAAYVLASAFLLEQCLTAWKEACLSRRRREASSSAAAAPGQAGGMSHAVTLWLTVQELVGRGILDTTNSTATTDKYLAKQAGKLCESAMQLLGFMQAAAHINGLLATSKTANPLKKHKQPDLQDSSKVTTAVATTISSGHAAGSRGRDSSSHRDFSVGMTEAEFQLQHCGNLLQRDVPAVRDPRVISFNPDLWQRAVLDAIDVDASAVVCAPTSSGKTFISSYCMDRVLRQSKDGVVVFVAPTKALVLKDFSKGEDKSVYGVFTRDYRINALEARILVTVPACLEILLFSPAHRDWVARLHYVIFDEVHCMREGGVKEGGTAENTGTIWEHCLLLIRCPFLALSATIGNPEQVTAWLQSVKALQQEQDTKLGIAGPPATYRVGLIQHAERYADLRYYSFKPGLDQQEGDCSNSSPSAAPASQGTGDAFNKIHPCSVLTAEQLQHSGFPSEVSLEPSDCLELFHAMHDAMHTRAPQGINGEPVQAPPASEVSNSTAATQTTGSPGLDPAVVGGPALPDLAAGSIAACDTDAESGQWRAAAQAALHELSPDVYFPGGKPISRSAVRVWEQTLKRQLVLWAAEHGTVGLQAVAQVLARLKERSAWDPSTTFTKESNDPVQFYRMLRALDQRDMLPALTFSFERRKCEKLAEGVVELLESGEARRREASGADWQRQQAAAECARKSEKASRDKKLGRKAAEDALQEEASGLAEVEEDSIDPDFSFAGRVRVLSPGELRKLIELATLGMEVDHPLKRALLRGIGVHHSGLPTKYRQVVEILFRCHYLRVVIATGTLAYGINMPCRTVVFAGDHIFLNSLQFRQMTGRAGRRGFDTLGHVIFWAVPSRKCTSLLVSPVPRLHGNFPMSVSLSLRMLTLHSAAPEDAQLQNDLLRLLQRPFYACEDSQLQQKMQHLFQFSLHYLQLQNALNAQGRPVQLAGMAMHLFWTEPANFAFVTLLRKGVFHRICAGVKPSADAPLSDSVARDMLLVLSHVFERVQLAPFVQADQETIHTSPSKVILEPLSPEVDCLLAGHNQEAVDNLVAYITAYISSSAEALPPGNVLPLSGHTYPPHAACTHSQQQLALGAGVSSDLAQEGGGTSKLGGQVSGALQAYRKQHRISSPFVSLSGYDEAFSSTQQLLRCVRPGILLDAASVPSVQMTNRNGQVLPLNRYILDYWGHGQKQALVHANGMREGDAWEHLRTFAGIVQAISTAMQKMVKGTAAESDPVVHCFGKLAEGFTAKHKAFNSAMQLQRG
ncbi:putative ATP-dependent RNA helicase ddx60 [Trebouxia sp. C0009 RCD-2024]